MSGKIVAFGEIMLRLTPFDKKMICGTDRFEAYYGGSESNVLVCLAGLGDETQYVTAIPDNDLGNAVLRHLRGYNVGTEHIVKQGDNLGMYFLEEGYGIRPAKVVYNRKNSEVTKMTAKDCDFDKMFTDCSIFHISGISFALSEAAKALSFTLIQEAKKRGIQVSFDFNYRGKLWSVSEAKEVFREVVKEADIIFCSEKDLNAFLDTDEEHFYEMYSPKYLVKREREVLPEGKHRASAVIKHYKEGNVEATAKSRVEFSVLERIGGGDAFAGGVLHCLNQNSEDIQRAVDFGMGCFILKHTVKGDVFSMDEKTVLAYVNDLSKDVSR